VRGEATTEDEKARGGVARWPVSTDNNAELGVGERPVITVTGRLHHWPGVRRDDPRGHDRRTDSATLVSFMMTSSVPPRMLRSGRSERGCRSSGSGRDHRGG
jgi:hypothetical protein